MLLTTALAFLRYESRKYLGAVFGVSLAVFLALLQSGFYFGFKRDITIVQDSFDADIWVVPRALLSFDYAVPLDDTAYWKALSDWNVEDATRVVFDWGKWRIPSSGAKESIQLLGLEPHSRVSFDFAGLDPTPLTYDGFVFIDARDSEKLGVRQIDDEAEILGRRATVAGFVKDKHLFSTSCLVVTDLDNARAFLKYPPNSISYVALKCRDKAGIAATATRLKASIPEHDVLVSKELHDLTQTYWESRSGIGPIMFLSAGLAVVVGFLTVFFTFYVLILQKVPVFAAMKAVGASSTELFGIIAIQIAVVFLVGVVLAGIGLAFALAGLSRTTISVVIPYPAACAALILIAIACVSACLPAVWKLSTVEPAEAFRT